VSFTALIASGCSESDGIFPPSIDIFYVESLLCCRSLRGIGDVAPLKMSICGVIKIPLLFFSFS
jgi:hypothetical protein